MRKQKGDVYLVALNGFYVSDNFLKVGGVHLDKEIEKAHVFDKLKEAVKCARELRGEILFYSHKRTEFHIFKDLYEFEEHEGY